MKQSNMLVPIANAVGKKVLRRVTLLSIGGGLMIPTRQKLIGKNKVEEWKFPVGLDDRVAVYINDIEVTETYDQAVERLEREA